jgi:ornithine cyclodeaminase/alanine dehydrogenase-like protein (mu-crystallin family)
MLSLDREATRQHLPLPALIEALRHLFVAGCEVPQRHIHTIPVAGGAEGTLLLMPAWQPGRHFGLKAVTVFPDNSALGLPAVHAIYTLFDARTGAPMAQLDGGELTARRTAAASALAASFLARADASRLLIVGAGRVAALLPQAHAVLRPIRSVQVWARRPQAAQELAARLRGEGLDAQAVQALGTAVAQADIVACATLAQQPLVEGAWLAAGTHLDLIGSFTPQMREVDSACVARSRVYIDTEEALRKSGDLLAAIADGALHAQAVQGTLSALCRGTAAGRGGAGEITLFKSVGTALEDLAAAGLAFGNSTAGAIPARAPRPHGAPP